MGNMKTKLTEPVSGIYKITNTINNLSYIGMSKNVNKRKEEHINKSGSTDNPLYEDFEKYGLDNFTFEVLEECPQELLEEKEVYWIAHYNTYEAGYNLTRGGNEPLFPSEILLPIIRDLQNTRLTMTNIADKYGVSSATISNINAGKVSRMPDRKYPIRDKDWVKPFLLLDVEKYSRKTPIAINTLLDKYKW